MDNRKIINCNLKFYMQQAGVTYPELSRRTGISIKTLQRYARSEVVPNLEKCSDISECLNIRIDLIWVVHRF